MSSTYRAICMAHDPAIEIDLFDGPNRREAKNIETALNALPAVRESHPGCDLLIGRYSYPLVEVFCPPAELDKRTCPTFHSVPTRVSIEWLTLLYHARQVPATEPLSGALAAFDRSCWGPRRVERLMRLIGDKYATSLEPLASVVVKPSSDEPVTESTDEPVQRPAYFHGGVADGQTRTVSMLPYSGHPPDILRLGDGTRADDYRLDRTACVLGQWHYRVLQPGTL